MRDADLEQVLAIECSSFGSPWKREHFAFEIHENPSAVNRVARKGDEVLAYACLHRLHGELKINNMAVRADHRRLGLGKWMLARVMREAARHGCTVVRLEVRPSNTAALRLYRGHGFREIGRRKGYYRAEQEDAIVMEAPPIPDRTS
jgi:ribosomal-protein-alanine N-acetyltransferase